MFNEIIRAYIHGLILDSDAYDAYWQYIDEYEKENCTTPENDSYKLHRETTLLIGDNKPYYSYLNGAFLIRCSYMGGFDNDDDWL